MRISQKEVTLKNGQVAILKSPEGEDAEQLLNYMKIMSGETNNVLRYPEEVTFTVEEERDHIINTLNEERNFDIAAFIDGKLVGNCGIFCMDTKIKIRHRTNLGIAILKDYWGIGIGDILMKHCMEQAKENGFEQIELGVITTNKSAIALYEKYGFETYGTLKHAQKLKDGSYQDLQMMVKFL
jgi:ribosomal protein S18 acetylase RimI-like enzyme